MTGKGQKLSLASCERNTEAALWALLRHLLARRWFAPAPFRAGSKGSIAGSIVLWLTQSMRFSLMPGYYCANGPGPSCTRVTSGGFHFPVNASDLGAYIRIVKLKAPFGAGNQFGSMSLPGLSFWK